LKRAGSGRGISRLADIDAAGKEMTALFVRDYPDYLIAPEILEGVFRQMMKSVTGAVRSS
jgi:hypothetical protein